jgi:hypothetical protein
MRHITTLMLATVSWTTVLPQARAQFWRQQGGGATDADPHDVLGVQRGASEKEIKVSDLTDWSLLHTHTHPWTVLRGRAAHELPLACVDLKLVRRVLM